MATTKMQPGPRICGQPQRATKQGSNGAHQLFPSPEELYLGAEDTECCTSLFFLPAAFQLIINTWLHPTSIVASFIFIPAADTWLDLQKPTVILRNTNFCEREFLRIKPKYYVFQTWTRSIFFEQPCQKEISKNGHLPPTTLLNYVCHHHHAC